MINHAEIEAKRREIDAIRSVEKNLPVEHFTRGQLAGAQQALYWVLDIGMEPVRAILSDAQLKTLAEIQAG